MASTRLPAKRYHRSVGCVAWSYGSQQFGGQQFATHTEYRSYGALVAVLVHESNNLHVVSESYNPTNDAPHSPTTTRHLRGLCLEHFGPSCIVSPAALDELVAYHHR